MLYLFIASPNSLTPFHVDRYSTILMQFRGDKEVCVFPPRDARVASADDCDAFMAYAPGRRPVWRPEAEPLGTSFQFSPGDALHIPFMAGHYVRNGANDVSISMSIIFNTRETARLSDAMRWNHYLRRKAGRFGFEPSPVGTSAQRDAAKALMWRSKQRVTRLVGVGH
ncbi:MAG: cupin-like domain-containing protein [Rhizobacter sp.]|nr:cupin-like domain-containing protein [Rhizobacter sp.]